MLMRPLKAVCSFCGRKNPVAAPLCAQCGGSLADARHESFSLPWACWIPGLLVAIFLLAEFQKARASHQLQLAQKAEELRQVGRAISDERAAARRRFDEEEQGREASHRQALANGRLISGELARLRHADEWARRHAHDPAFAQSLLEKTLLEVEKLGKDPALQAEAALRLVAEKVAPPGSRVEVTPEGGQFAIRVAFKLSSVLPQETGGATRHSTSLEMRRDIEDVTARLIKELFDYCGSRGIARLSVSCNRAVRTRLPGAENDSLVMRSLYRASVHAGAASDVSDWRRIPLAKVAAILKVERDLISSLSLVNSDGPVAPLDPAQPLEF